MTTPAPAQFQVPELTPEDIERMARNLAWQGQHGLTPRELWGDDDA